MNTKTLFINEVENIENEKLKNACLSMIDDIPEYFWTVPASSSGKYHPNCDLGEGGLVRHSIMVCRIATDLCEAEIYGRRNQNYKDMAIVAALFHDVMKQGDGTSGHTEFIHPNLGATFVREHLEVSDIDPIIVEIICDGIRSHMGRWRTSQYEPEVLLRGPKTDFEMLIHTADYIASRKYIGGLAEWA